MILYDPQVPISMQPFGIQIPVHDSRAVKTIEALRSIPRLKKTVTHWHHDRITETLTREDLQRAHAPDYVDRLYSNQLEKEIVSTYELIGPDGAFNRYAPEQATLPLSGLFDRILLKAAGSFQCGRLALVNGFCFYFAGGMHHAHADHGSGFCLINDVVIAARKLQAQTKVRSIWIVDVDAHKGDGTAALTAGDQTIKTLSIHMARGWPLDGPETLADGRPNPCFTPSDIDIPMEMGEEAHYVDRLSNGLAQLEQMGPADMAIVVCGADPYEKDELPSTRTLKLSLQQMLARDQLVFEFLQTRRIPMAFLMAGGYGSQAWRVYAQFLTWVLGKPFWFRANVNANWICSERQTNSWT